MPTMIYSTLAEIVALKIHQFNRSFPSFHHHQTSQREQKGKAAKKKGKKGLRERKTT
jgi:hypothetical protein